MSFSSLNCPKGVSHRAICISKYMLFTGWEVRIGRNCARDLCESTARGRRPRAVLRPSAQFLPIRTDLGRWRTFLFFFPLRFKNFRNILLQLPTYVCWRRARYFASLEIFMHQGYRTHRLTKSLPIFFCMDKRLLEVFVVKCIQWKYWMSFIACGR